MNVTIDDYKSDVEIAWCPGCGNFPILDAVKKALVELNRAPHEVAIVTGIGQAPKLPHYMNVNTYNGLHGREVASAQAIKLAADDLTVIVHAGDGGAYGEGGNHFIHAIRRNIDMTLVVHDNHIYGLTKGQASPTTDAGHITMVNPRGVASRPMNPLALAISQSCSFVAQATSGEGEHLKGILKAAIENPGFSLVNVLQPCVTWDKVRTYKYYEEHCDILDDSYDPSNRASALELTLRDDDRIPLGIIYREQRTPYDEIVLKDIEHPLRDRGVDPKRAEKLFDKFM
jgi:2-oxoglutarate ferredoxin oxidoreductase subunit beta